MASLLLFLNMLMLISIETVLSDTCPSCMSTKHECDETKNIKSMDCDTFKIDNKDPKESVNETKFLSHIIPALELMKSNKEKMNLTVGCFHIDYTMMNLNPNDTLKPKPGTLYTMKSCMFQNKDVGACVMAKHPQFLERTVPALKDRINMTVEKCTFTEFTKDTKSQSSNSARFSTLSEELVMLITFAALLTFFV